MTDIPEYVIEEPTMDVDTIIKRYSNLVVAYNNLVDSYATVIEERNDLMGLEIVKHGYLIDLPKALNPSERPVKCSVCGIVTSLYYGYKPRYCSNCGAKFVEEEE